MICLLDTHLLLWAASQPHKLSQRAVTLIEDRRNTLVFSAASIWEVSIKATLDRPDFQTSPSRLRRGLLEHGYEELAISGRHALAVENLPAIHKDPFDRILIAQAHTEDITLITNDRLVAQYPGQIEFV